jgi:enoyl-CoA hydratase/carnithine racemase
LFALLPDDGNGIFPNAGGAELLDRALGLVTAVEYCGCDALTHEILLV